MLPQPNKNCEEILAKKIALYNFDKKKRKESFDAIRKAFTELIGCGIDSIDYQIFFGRMILSLNLNLTEVVEKNQDKTVITYSQLLNSILKLRENESHKKLRKYYESSYKLASKVVDIKNWEEDKFLLQEIGTPDKAIKVIHEILIKNSDTTYTYKEFLRKYRSQISLATRKNPAHRSDLDSPAKEYSRISKEYDYPKALLMSAEFKKPILLYFTGYDSIDSIAMERVILHNEKFRTIIDEQFIFLPLYVDDKTELPYKEWYKSDFLHMTIKSKGNKNLEFEMQKFGSKSQPLYLIVNSEEAVLGQIGYCTDRRKFFKFLNEGLEKFQNNAR